MTAGKSFILPFATAAVLAATSANASIIIINGMTQGNNVNLPSTFGSNLSSDIPGATVTNGATPDIALTWAGDWETHNASTWNHLDPAAAGVDVLQIEAAPSTVTFTVGAGVALVVNSLDIANATDQPGSVADFAWTISIAESGGGPDVFTYTTAPMGAGDIENVDISFTGTIGTDYVLTFDNPTNQGRYGAIDNLSFNQTTGTDLTPPTIVAMDPADDSTGVAVDTNFVATFSENIALTATGTITVTDGSETRVVNLDGSADDGDASVLNKVLTITLDTDLTNLNSSYDVLISNDAIVDTAAAQNPFAGTVTGDWNFTTSDGSTGSSVIVFNGISGANNSAIPSDFGSNLSSDIGGATVSNGGTPNIALTWAGPNGGWDLHGGGGASFWAALDSDNATTPSVAQMESPTTASPNTVTFTVDAGWALQLNSVDIGMATDKTDTYYWNVTISEVGGAEVFSTLTAAMDGDGGSGVQALTVPLNFTGTVGTDYVLAFNDVDGSGNDTISTNGGAIDNLSFSQVIGGPDETPPAIASGAPFGPSNGTSDVAVDSDLVLTFNEAVQAGSGFIVIRRISDGGLIMSIDVGSANVIVEGAQVTIVPPSDLPGLTGLYVEVDSGAFMDLAGNPFAGISGSETWSFTTAPVLQLFISSNGPDFDFTWPSRPGKAYDLLSSTDLGTPPATWAVYDPDGEGGIPPYGDIPSDGLQTTLTAVPGNGPRRFFVVSEKDAPPVVLVEAHRGDSINAPENTVASIQAAATSADLTEFDVRVTSDGELVLMHDATVDRTTDGSGAVSSFTLAQLKLLDAGSWFSAAFAGEQVPTMAEAIGAALAANIEPLVERKAGNAADYHAEFVSLGLAPEDFRVICFDWSFLAALDALNPAYRLGALGGGTITQSVIDNVKAMGGDFLDWNHAAIDQAAVDLVHANGMELHAYTVNDGTRMQQLINFGIDGITTDNPTLLRSLVP